MLEADVPRKWPKLQVALDLIDLAEALRIAKAAYRGGGRWLEAGTPLIKSVGIKAVQELKKRFPRAVVVADLKTMDVGGLETEIAAKANADVVCVCGVAGDSTVRDAVMAGRRLGVKIMADLIEVKDPIKRAVELEGLGVDYVCVHTGIDVQKDRKETIVKRADQIASIVKAVEIPIAAAGGLQAETAPFIVKSGVKIVIVGGAITKAANPELAAREIWRAIEEAS